MIEEDISSRNKAFSFRLGQIFWIIYNYKYITAYFTAGSINMYFPAQIAIYYYP
jgi:hypothetical protein